MAFKGDSDDTRSSLSYKLKRILRFRAGTVLCTDPYVTTDDRARPARRRARRGRDLLVRRRAAHRRTARCEPTQPVVDVWNLFGNGVTA